MQYSNLNFLTSDSAKSKIDKSSKITNWVKLKKKNNNKEHHSKALLNSFPMNGHRVLYMESKVRKLCHTQDFNLEVKGLKQAYH